MQNWRRLDVKNWKYMFAALCNQSLNCCGGILARFYLQLIHAFIFPFLHTSGPSCLCLGSLFCSIIELILCFWSQADCLIGHSSLGFCGREQIHGSIVNEKVSRFWSSKAADHHGRTAVFDCRYVALIVKRCVHFTPNITRPMSSKKFGFLAHHYLSQILEGVITLLFFYHIWEVFFWGFACEALSSLDVHRDLLISYVLYYLYLSLY